jgi:hypothetical protein
MNNIVGHVARHLIIKNIREIKKEQRIALIA